LAYLLLVERRGAPLLKPPGANLSLIAVRRMLPNPGGTGLDIPTIGGKEGCASFEAARRKLEFNSCAEDVAKSWEYRS